MKINGNLNSKLILSALAGICIAVLTIGSLNANARNPEANEGVIGWDGDWYGTFTFPDGSIHVHDNMEVTAGYLITNGVPSFKWYLDHGYLPCTISEFEKDSCTIRILNFGDKVTINGKDYVIIYSSCWIRNNGTNEVTLDPAPYGGLIPLNSVSNTIAPGQEAYHDYAIAADRFGQLYSWPTAEEIKKAGSRQAHWEHMNSYWESRLSKITKIVNLPDPKLVEAYKAGFIYTHIIKDGWNLNVGENGYDCVYDHDTIGILSTLLTIGDFTDAKRFLTGLQAQLQYDDAKWKFSWPWALYLQKTGDIGFVKIHFEDIKKYTHCIESDMTGEGGIMKKTHDIDAEGYWTVDNCSALLGLVTYKYICDRLNESSESAWAFNLYNKLLSSVNKVLSQTINDNNLNYIPVSMTQPNTSNRCSDPKDANWASMFLFGRWFWDGYLFNAKQEGVLLDKIDATYDSGFERLAGKLPAHDFGGFENVAKYSSSYNAGYGSAGLRGKGKYRAEGIRAYQFMINNTQNAPYGWWEGCGNPGNSNWSGYHPVCGTGSVPHMWGQSTATKVLIDSLISEKCDGTLIIGRGIPKEWIENYTVPIEVSNYPTSNNQRVEFKLECDSYGRLRLNRPFVGKAILYLPVDTNSANAGDPIDLGTDHSVYYFTIKK